MRQKILFIFFLQTLLSYPEVFKYQYIVGDKYRVECTIEGKQFVNSIFLASYFQEYKTVSLVRDCKDDIATIFESYFYYNKNSFVTSEIKELKENVDVSYSRDKQGRMTVSNTDYLPTLRNAPFFLESDVKPGDKWDVPAYEVQDLFGDKKISIFPIDVYYTFVGYEELNGKKLAKIYYEFNINLTNSTNYKIDDRIISVNGNSKTTLYFDNKLGIKVKEIYNRDYTFEINDYGVVKYVEFIDKGERNWYPIELMKKDDIVNEIKKDLKDKDIENTEITKDDKGVKITLENIQFDANSSILQQKEIERLDKIADILKKYKDRGVMIEGHTTDRGTKKGREILSLERAKSVADFLINKEAIDPKKSSYIGRGGSNPIASNDSEDGLKKNRRVEIYILEE